MDGALDVAQYILDEIKINIKGAHVRKIREQLDYDGSRRKQWHELTIFGKTTIPYPTPNLVSAMALWTERVYKGRPWDHKTKIIMIPELKSLGTPRKVRTLSEVKKQRFEGEIPLNSKSFWHKYKDYDYYFDVWSNIHYGYVGLACGFTEDILLNGAGLAQFLDNFTIAGDAPDDIMSIKLGFNLYKKYGDSASELTSEILLTELSLLDFIESRDFHVCIHQNREELENSDF